MTQKTPVAALLLAILEAIVSELDWSSHRTEEVTRPWSVPQGDTKRLVYNLVITLQT